MLSSGDLVVWNNKITLHDKKEVGIDIATLGELAHHGIVIHHRLVITPNALDRFLKENNLEIQLKHLLGSIDHDRHDSLTQVSNYIRKIITHSELPKDIVTPLFKNFELITEKKVNLRALYFKDGDQIGEENWQDITGEAVLAESIRIAWSQLFSAGYLKSHTIHHKNHHQFSAVLVVIPQTTYSLTGEVRTYGNRKDEFEIEAHKMVKYVYNKSSKSFTQGHLHHPDAKATLSIPDLKKLLDYAHNAHNAIYFPHILYWGKLKNDFVVNSLTHSIGVDPPKDTYNSLIKSVSVHPGVVVGRLKVIDEREKIALVANEEIIFIKSLNKEMINVVKRAKGLILEEKPHPEIVHLLREVGIPTVIRDKKSFLYSTGDVISLNATTGEIKRGSMLVS